MKSQIRVDYKSRYGDGDFGEKEPIIRVVLEKSDDPRDTLLGEIFKHDSTGKRIGVNKLPDTETFTIYKRSDREYKINDIVSPIFIALTKYSGIEAIFVTGTNEMYFELANNYKIRSKGFERSEDFITSWHKEDLEYERELELRFIQAIIDDWKDFEKIVKESQKKTK